MDNKLIQALKKNEKPFGLMTEEMQDAMTKLSLQNIEQFRDAMWNRDLHDNHNALYDHNAYRLRPDYEQEAEIVSYPITRRGDDRLVYGKVGQFGCFGDISQCINLPDFIGFKYKDGRFSVDPRRYRTKSHNAVADGNIAHSPDFDMLDRFEVLTPTHVLFKRSK